jgi:hypothetical protein
MRLISLAAFALFLLSAPASAQEAEVSIRVSSYRQGTTLQFEVIAPSNVVTVVGGSQLPERTAPSLLRMKAPAQLSADLTHGAVEIQSLTPDTWVQVAVSGGRAAITAAGLRLRISLEKGRLEVRGLPPVSASDGR